MGYTITEKILMAHTDLKEIAPGRLINARVDIALGNKAGDIHSCTTHAISDISEAFILQLMQANFTASAD